MTATLSPSAAASPALTALSAPKLRDSAISWDENDCSSASSLRRSSSEPSGEPSTTNTTSSGPSRCRANSALRSTTAGRVCSLR